MNPIDINQTILDASLDKMHDIVTPEAIGFFPLADGWYILLLFSLALLYHFAHRYYLDYHQNRYRGAALQEMKSLKNRNRADTMALLKLAKRVAISGYGREVAAKLYDESWFEFVQNNSRAKISTSLRDEMRRVMYDKSGEFDKTLYGEIYYWVEEWIVTHRVDRDV